MTMVNDLEEIYNICVRVMEFVLEICVWVENLSEDDVCMIGLCLNCCKDMDFVFFGVVCMFCKVESLFLEFEVKIFGVCNLWF